MSKACTVALILIVLGGIALAQKPVAQLPKVYINSTYNLPLGGTTWAAHTSAQLSSAITSSSPGDVIVLDAGVTYSGHFQLPGKTNPNNKWTYIVSSRLANLPAGARVSPASAVNMPKIVTPTVAADFQINGGANHWRLAGLELTAASNYPAGCGVAGQPNCMTYFLLGSQSNTTPEPDSITIDRCYIHGSATQDIQSAVQLTASNYAVVDSYIDNIHEKGFDSSGIFAYWTPGPIKIVNNYVSASTENILFGGAGGPSTPWVPSDIEIRNNYLFKPLAWVPLSLTPIGSLIEKNAFELKSAQRVLFDSNTIENVWAAGQSGEAIVLTVRSSQSGDIAVVNDITITNNVLKNVTGGFSSLAKDYQCGTSSYPNCHNAGSQDRWNIANNLITFYDPTIQGGGRNEIMEFDPGVDVPNGGAYGVMRDVVLQHNTAIAASSGPCWQSLYFNVGATVKPPFSGITNNIWILDNTLCRQPTGGWGQLGLTGITEYMGIPNAPPYDITQRFYGNVMYAPPGEKVQAWPVHNYATTVPSTYVNPGAFDYQLLTPYWTDTSDGKLSGINYSALSGALGASGQLPSGINSASNPVGISYTPTSSASAPFKISLGTAAH